MHRLQVLSWLHVNQRWSVNFYVFWMQKKYKKDFNKDLIKIFPGIYWLCGGDINKFILLLRKGVYPYEWIHG